MYEWNRGGKRRLGIDIPIELFKVIKQICNNQNITLTDWMMKAISAQLKKEKIE